MWRAPRLRQGAQYRLFITIFHFYSDVTNGTCAAKNSRKTEPIINTEPKTSIPRASLSSSFPPAAGTFVIITIPRPRSGTPIRSITTPKIVARLAIS